MAEDDTDRARPPLPGMPEIDRELERLRDRLGVLHASVDDLGRRPPPEPAPSPTVAIPAGAGTPRAPAEPPATPRPSTPISGHPAAAAPVFAPPPATPPPPPPRPGPPPHSAGPLGPPPPVQPSAPAAGEPATAPEAPGPPGAPPVPGPAASGSQPEATDASASFVVVDAGPIAGLAAARRFEDALSALPAVREVRLRRFSRRRAELEVGLSEPHALGPELPMLELPAQIEAFRRDRLVLHVGEQAGER